MDRRTIHDVGIPGIVLMERAAIGAVESLLAHFTEQTAGRTARVGFMCGGGNNGGDGFAMARMLHELGHHVWVGTMKPGNAYAADAKANLDVLDKIGIDVRDLSDYGESDLAAVLELLEPFDVWVDGLFGTGLDREVEGTYRSAIEFLNSQPRVLAVDVPSGVHADTGQVLGVAVHAEATATFGHVKVGQAIYPGRQHCGTLYPIDIGIPARVVRDVGWEGELLVGDRWVPPRGATMHKGNAGRLALVGGAEGTTGAILMTATAALRSGAGLVKVGTYDACVAHVAPAVHEAMAVGVLAKTLEQRHADELDDLFSWADVIAIGPGMGKNDGTLEVLELALDSDALVVVDADGLTLMADNRMKLKNPGVDTLVLTPHPGEAARLAGCDVEDILADPVRHALELSAEWGAIVVLKGAATIVADAEPRRVAVNTSGNPGMATGGMGDALTGIIAAHLVDFADPFEAVCNAVWVHGMAGDAAAELVGHRGLTVSALLEALPGVWRALEAP